VIKRQHTKEGLLGLLVLCQVRFILERSLREEKLWWIFVSDLTLLMN
jgi:hypothetical protein